VGRAGMQPAQRAETEFSDRAGERGALDGTVSLVHRHPLEFQDTTSARECGAPLRATHTVRIRQVQRMPRVSCRMPAQVSGGICARTRAPKRAADESIVCA
jgi:hypothetical protein